MNSRLKRDFFSPKNRKFIVYSAGSRKNRPRFKREIFALALWINSKGKKKSVYKSGSRINHEHLNQVRLY